MSYDAVKAYFSIHLRGISKAKRLHVPAVQESQLKQPNKSSFSARVHRPTCWAVTKSNTLAGYMNVCMLHSDIHLCPQWVKESKKTA